MNKKSKRVALGMLIAVSLIALCPLAYLGVLTLQTEPAWLEIRHSQTLSAEHTSEYELDVMRSCRLGGSVTFVPQTGKTESAIPLPNGSTVFSNQEYPEHEGQTQYLAVGEMFWDCVDRWRQLAGFECEQLGNLFVLDSKDGALRVVIARDNYARKYERFTVEETAKT